MAYEREAMPPAVVGEANISPVLREERTIDPHIRTQSLNRALQGRGDVGQTNTNIASDRAAPAATEETVTLSPQMAALARERQKIRRDQQAMAAEKAALANERAEIADLKAMKAKLQAKDYSAVESLVDHDEYTKYLIEKAGAEDPAEQKIRALAEKIDSVEKSQKENVSKQFEAAVNERRVKVNALVESEPALHLIKKLKQQDAVVQHILDTWEHDDIELTPEQAAKEVAEELSDRQKKWAALSEGEAAPAVEEKRQLPPLKPQIKTLTNQMTPPSGEVKRPIKSFQNMNDTERLAEARRRAEEKLKAQTR